MRTIGKRIRYDITTLRSTTEAMSWSVGQSDPYQSSAQLTIIDHSDDQILVKSGPGLNYRPT